MPQQPTGIRRPVGQANRRGLRTHPGLWGHWGDQCHQTTRGRSLRSYAAGILISALTCEYRRTDFCKKRLDPNHS